MINLILVGWMALAIIIIIATICMTFMPKLVAHFINGIPTAGWVLLFLITELCLITSIKYAFFL